MICNALIELVKDSKFISFSSCFEIIRIEFKGLMPCLKYRAGSSRLCGRPPGLVDTAVAGAWSIERVK